MFKNYLKIGLRNLLRHRGHAFINVTGLAIGMACCLLILLYVRQELSYDRYHEKADRIYRLTTEAGVSGTLTHFAGAAAPMAAVMQTTFPEVEHAVRVLEGSQMVRTGDKRFKENHFYYADSTVFDVFSYTFVAGDATTALNRPHTVVLTRSTAEKYFGEANPLGKTLQAGDDRTFTVTGVIEDVPAPSHFRFDLLASLSSLPWSQDDDWLANLSFKTYLVLHPGASPEALSAKFSPLVEQNVGAILQEIGGVVRFNLQPLTDIHLHSNLESELQPNSDISYVYILSVVAFVILLIACINFMNLATARSVDRAKEVGMRKVLGAYRTQLIRQFLAETILLAAFAFGFAWVIVALILPAFNQVAERELSMSLTDNGLMLAGFAGLTLIVGLLAGSYPALFLSGFQPARVLKGTFKTSMAGVALRKGLVVAQFAISITLIIGTFVVQRQLDYARNRHLGFDKEQVIVLPIYQDEAVREHAASLKATVQQNPNVVSVTAADHFPGGPSDDRVFFPEGKGVDEGIHMRVYRVDFDYLKTLDMALAAGRDFSRTQLTDSGAVLVNETAMQMLGWDSIEGKQFVEFADQNLDSIRSTVPVIGTVEDFHFESFRSTIRPLLIQIGAGNPGNLIVRVRPGRIPDVLASLKEQWEALAANAPFEYTFLDEAFDQLYRADQRLGRLFSYFAGLAVFIACMGLFGLATFAVEQRTKEIGVRKILGASTGGLVVLLSKDFAYLVAIAFVVALPVAYLSMQRWLSSFAYRTEIGLAPFVWAGVLALATALLTVSYQAVRAALANPLNKLRYE